VPALLYSGAAAAVAAVYWQLDDYLMTLSFEIKSLITLKI